MTTTVYATQDVFTAASSPNTNFEGNDLLVYGSGSRIYSYIDFDLSSFAGKTIDEALIKLYIVVNDLTSSTRIRFYRIDRSWDASEATYNDPPHVTDVNAKNGYMYWNRDSMWEQWNVTDLVNDVIDGGGYGIRVEIDANQLVQFASIEGDYSHRPKIEITEYECTPGDRTCIGNDVYECNTEGSAFDVFIETCSNGCKNGVCTGNGIIDEIGIKEILIGAAVLIGAYVLLPKES